jgi:hypothetical protein
VLGRRWLSLLLLALVAVVWPSRASAWTSANAQTRVGVFEVAAHAVVGAASARSPGNHRAKSFAGWPLASDNALAAEESTALVEGGEVWNARGGIDFSKSTAFEGQVQIQYTGSRTLDYQAANQAAGLGDSMRAPSGFVWHHLDDYNPLTNTGTMQLVDQGAHMANAPHFGGVAQWVEWMGVPYAP